MPRINIEDGIFKQREFIDLCIAAGSRRMALGALTELWIEAQKHYIEHGEIPNEEWVRADLPEYLVTTKWAERTPTGVKAWGQEKQFGWLRQRSEAGKSSSENKTKTLKQNSERSFGNSPNGTERNETDTEPLSLFSSSNSISNSFSEEKTLPSGDGASWKILLEIYNENRKTLPKAIAWNKDRERHAAARWKELSDKDQWKNVVEYFASSPHHTGKNDRGWVASFDFILQPGRWTQALENGAQEAPQSFNRASQMVSSNQSALEAFKKKRAVNP